jgi:hypothetical protein
VSARLVVEGGPKGKKKPKKGEPSNVLLEVVMREAVKPQHRVVQNADGTATLVVDFPKPSKPPPPEPDEQQPAPKAQGAEN